MLKKIIIGVILFTIILGGFMVFQAWKYLYKTNTPENNELVFYIYSTDTFESVKKRLYEKKYILNIKTFNWVAHKMNLHNHIHKGRYRLPSGATNRELITLLRSGIQEPIHITFNNIRTKEALAQSLSNQINTDSSAIIERLYNQSYAQKLGFTVENFGCMFIPNTYEIYWSINTDALFNRFLKEYKTFWNNTRLQKAEKLNLTPIEVGILASIIEKETAIIDEYPVIAGVYLNRLKKGMPLQADPTVVFAIGDFTIKRILNKHLKIESPYNTYKNKGLPPGPIGIPSPQAIDGVLNANQHGYIFFCAKDDFSGQHIFAKTLPQHNQNAKRYRKALSKKKIYK